MNRRFSSRLFWVWGLAVVPTAGCERSTAGLSPDEVTSIPDGDAHGDAWSGAFRIEQEVVECSGRCGPIDTDFGDEMVCEVGETDTAEAFVEQRDGHLEAEADGGDIGPWVGGVDADGSFDLGAFLAAADGELDLTITSRAEGSFSDADHFEVTTRTHAEGTYRGQRIDCVKAQHGVGARRDDGGDGDAPGAPVSGTAD